MIGIDTNILLRFILADDPVQLERTKAFLANRSAEDPAFISLAVIAETCWVLRRRYGYRNDVIARTLHQLLDAEEFLFEDEYFVDDLLTEESNLAADISDYIIAHIAIRSGCNKVVTFDVKAAKAVPGMELLQ
ncbi:MAG: PilT protein domain protein [Rhizobium sp.]|nr:PilT protein domain protein [Rhizobium sp.]